jgi:hypothetical protein
VGATLSTHACWYTLGTSVVRLVKLPQDESLRLMLDVSLVDNAAVEDEAEDDITEDD